MVLVFSILQAARSAEPQFGTGVGSAWPTPVPNWGSALRAACKSLSPGFSIKPDLALNLEFDLIGQGEQSALDPIDYQYSLGKHA